MRWRLMLTVSVLVIAIAAVNCMGELNIKGSGKLGSEERSFKGITGVVLRTFGTLYIEIGSIEKLKIEADDNLFEYFETKIDNGILRIGKRSKTNINTKKEVKYYLTVKELESIVISSSGDIIAPDIKAEKFFIFITSSGDLEMGDLETKDLGVDIRSSGDIEMGNLIAENIDVSISYSGDLIIKGGEVKSQQIDISSSGDYEAKKLKSEDAKVMLSSSGDAIIRVANSLNASLSSSGDVYYRGNPEVTKSESSSGEVQHMGN